MNNKSKGSDVRGPRRRARDASPKASFEEGLDAEAGVENAPREPRRSGARNDDVERGGVPSTSARDARADSKAPSAGRAADRPSPAIGAGGAPMKKSRARPRPRGK
jgi:hypothetical protein